MIAQGSRPADQAPSIAFFGTEDTWKAGWDTAHARLAALGHAGVNLYLAPGQAHSFFNQDPWQTLTLIEADRFLVRLRLGYPAPEAELLMMTERRRS